MKFLKVVVFIVALLMTALVVFFNGFGCEGNGLDCKLFLPHIFCLWGMFGAGIFILAGEGSFSPRFTLLFKIIFWLSFIFPLATTFAVHFLL